MSPEGYDPQEVVYGDTYKPKKVKTTKPNQVDVNKEIEKILAVLWLQARTGQDGIKCQNKAKQDLITLIEGNYGDSASPSVSNEVGGNQVDKLFKSTGELYNILTNFGDRSWVGTDISIPKIIRWHIRKSRELLDDLAFSIALGVWTDTDKSYERGRNDAIDAVLTIIQHRVTDLANTISDTKLKSSKPSKETIKLIEGIIGEDETITLPIKIAPEGIDINGLQKLARNYLRAEQRKKLDDMRKSLGGLL
ncbi:MAG TPA: hypothetical protein VII94_00275 [Candidatus Saccharimonadales bacterium]